MTYKHGDLAVGVCPEIFSGRLCTVVRQAPVDYHDSCGHWNPPNDAMSKRWGPMWVVDWAAPFQLGDDRIAYRDCLVYDAFIRPINGDGITDSEVTELYRPAPARTKEGEAA